MKLRLATHADLPQLTAMYTAIVCEMNRTGLAIWDDVYPCAFLGEDIDAAQLYVLFHDSEIILGAFALCPTNQGAPHVQWAAPAAPAFYIDRLGVNVDFQHQGVGSALLAHAAQICRQKSAAYLRLFVVEGNTPALHLYEKNGFTRVIGTYTEVIDDDFSMTEYGFEQKL